MNLAPNGKPSNLTPEQYRLVRTPAFKNWFGDWENSPETASKVVDSNGEPLVVYHGTENSFNVFSEYGLTDNGWYGLGFYFTPSKKMAKEWTSWGEKENILECFLNIRKMYDCNKINPFYNNSELYTKKYIKEGFMGSSFTVDKNKYYHEYCVFYPFNRNIKLADGTNTTFDSNNPDIRYSDGGEVVLAPNGKPSNLTPEQYRLVRTPAFKAWFGDWEKSPETASKILDDNGEPLVCYHGSNNDFNEFRSDVGYSHDKGFYGRGFYFTFNPDSKWMRFAKDEAGYYGSKIKDFFIQSFTPFDISELSKYKEVGIGYVGTESIVFLSNIAKMFPQLSDKIKVEQKKWNTNTQEYDFIDLPISILPNLIEEYSKKVKTFITEDNWGNKNRVSGYVKSEIVEYDKGKTYESMDTLGTYDILLKKEEIEILLICDAIEKYDGIDARYQPEGYMTRFPEITDAIKETHDSILQTKYGDELVVFKPTQIKLADGTNTTFDSNNPDIRYKNGGLTMKKGGKITESEIKQNLSFVEEKLNQKKLTPSQILYLASLLNFSHHDIENKGISDKKIINFYEKRNELIKRIEEIAKPIRKGYVGYLDEEEAYHFTNLASIFHIIEDGRINTINNNLSITTNFLLGEKGTSTVRDYRGMGNNAELFSDLPVKLVLDMDKLKKEAVFNTGKWSGGTHFGEYEFVVSGFKKPFPYYIKRIEIDKNEMDESGILDEPLSIYKDYKYSSKSKPITISFKDQVKKLNIPIIERKRIDVKEYLFGENSKNIRYAQGGGLDNVEVKIIEDDGLAEKVYDIVQDDLSVAVPRLALIENGRVIGGIYLEPANSYVLDGKRTIEPLSEYKFDIYIKRSKRKKGYSKILLDAMIDDFVNNFPDADQIRGEVINNRLEKSLVKNYGFNCDSGNQEEITYCYLSREKAMDYIENKKFAFGGKLKEMVDLQRKGSFKDKANFIKKNPEVLVGKFSEGGRTLLEIINTDGEPNILNDIVDGWTLTSEEVESKLGRKLDSWNDDIVYLSGIKYKKVYLRPEYKKVI